MTYSVVPDICWPQAPLAQLAKEGNKDLEVEALRVEAGLRRFIIGGLIIRIGFWGLLHLSVV